MPPRASLVLALLALGACRGAASGDSGETASDGDTTAGSDASGDGGSGDADDGSDDDGSEGNSADDGSESGDTADTGEPTCDATHHAAEAVAWSLPTPPTSLEYEPFIRMAGDNVCADGSYGFQYTTVDLTGDGALDLVVTSACDDGAVGTDGWLVYAGGASGFADEPSLWALPDPIVALEYEPFTRMAGDNVCADGSYGFQYTTVDLTGDGTPDLVVTSACDDGDVGTTAWLVYAGGDGGFASEPATWSLPEPTATLEYEPFTRMAGDNVCPDGSYGFQYTTVDLTGDGALDLVVTSACDAGDVGTTDWLFYAGGSDGFADQPATWSLPEPTATLEYEPFTRMAGDNVCPDGSYGFQYTTADLTGDDAPDLVVTSACDSGDVGTTAWLFYAGGATGFSAEPSTWVLPEPTATLEYEPFTRMAGDNVCPDGSYGFQYTSTDLTGDGVIDLVVTSACDAGDVGTEGWLIYVGGSDGFSGDASLWTLPEPIVDLEYEPFIRMAGDNVCADGSYGFQYTTADLTADGLADLVVTSACDDGDVGTTAWLVHPAQCG